MIKRPHLGETDFKSVMNFHKNRDMQKMIRNVRRKHNRKKYKSALYIGGMVILIILSILAFLYCRSA